MPKAVGNPIGASSSSNPMFKSVSIPSNGLKALKPRISKRIVRWHQRGKYDSVSDLVEIFNYTANPIPLEGLSFKDTDLSKQSIKWDQLKLKSINLVGSGVTPEQLAKCETIDHCIIDVKTYQLIEAYNRTNPSQSIELDTFRICLQTNSDVDTYQSLNMSLPIEPIADVEVAKDAFKQKLVDHMVGTSVSEPSETVSPFKVIELLDLYHENKIKLNLSSFKVAINTAEDLKCYRFLREGVKKKLSEQQTYLYNTSDYLPQVVLIDQEALGAETEPDLSYFNLRFSNLMGIDLTKCRLKGADLRYARFDQDVTKITDYPLARTQFSEPELAMASETATTKIEDVNSESLGKDQQLDADARTEPLMRRIWRSTTEFLKRFFGNGLVSASKSEKENIKKLTTAKDSLKEGYLDEAQRALLESQFTYTLESIKEMDPTRINPKLNVAITKLDELEAWAELKTTHHLTNQIVFKEFKLPQEIVDEEPKRTQPAIVDEDTKQAQHAIVYTNPERAQLKLEQLTRDQRKLALLQKAVKHLHQCGDIPKSISQPRNAEACLIIFKHVTKQSISFSEVLKAYQRDPKLTKQIINAFPLFRVAFPTLEELKELNTTQEPEKDAETGLSQTHILEGMLIPFELKSANAKQEGEWKVWSEVIKKINVNSETLALIRLAYNPNRTDKLVTLLNQSESLAEHAKCLPMGLSDTSRSTSSRAQPKDKIIQQIEKDKEMLIKGDPASKVSKPTKKSPTSLPQSPSSPQSPSLPQSTEAKPKIHSSLLDAVNVLTKFDDTQKKLESLSGEIDELQTTITIEEESKRRLDDQEKEQAQELERHREKLGELKEETSIQLRDYAPHSLFHKTDQDAAIIAILVANQRCWDGVPGAEDYSDGFKHIARWNLLKKIQSPYHARKESQSSPLPSNQDKLRQAKQTLTGLLDDLATTYHDIETQLKPYADEYPYIKSLLHRFKMKLQTLDSHAKKIPDKEKKPLITTVFLTKPTQDSSPSGGQRIPLWRKTSQTPDLDNLLSDTKQMHQQWLKQTQFFGASDMNSVSTIVYSMGGLNGQLFSCPYRYADQLGVSPPAAIDPLKSGLQALRDHHKKRKPPQALKDDYQTIKQCQLKACKQVAKDVKNKILEYYGITDIDSKNISTDDGKSASVQDIYEAFIQKAKELADNKRGTILKRFHEWPLLFQAMYVIQNLSEQNQTAQSDNTKQGKPSAELTSGDKTLSSEGNNQPVQDSTAQSDSTKKGNPWAELKSGDTTLSSKGNNQPVQDSTLWSQASKMLDILLGGTQTDKKDADDGRSSVSKNDKAIIHELEVELAYDSADEDIKLVNLFYSAIGVETAWDRAKSGIQKHKVQRVPQAEQPQEVITPSASQTQANIAGPSSSDQTNKKLLKILEKINTQSDRDPTDTSLDNVLSILKYSCGTEYSDWCFLKIYLQEQAHLISIEDTDSPKSTFQKYVDVMAELDEKLEKSAWMYSRLQMESKKKPRVLLQSTNAPSAVHDQSRATAPTTAPSAVHDQSRATDADGPTSSISWNTWDEPVLSATATAQEINEATGNFYDDEAVPPRSTATAQEIAPHSLIHKLKAIDCGTLTLNDLGLDRIDELCEHVNNLVSNISTDASFKQLVEISGELSRILGIVPRTGNDSFSKLSALLQSRREEVQKRIDVLRLDKQGNQILEDLKEKQVDDGLVDVWGAASRLFLERKDPPALPKIDGEKVSVTPTTTEPWAVVIDALNWFGASSKASKSASSKIVSGELADEYERYMLEYSDQVSLAVIVEAIVSLQKDLDANKQGFNKAQKEKYKQVMSCLKILHHSKTNESKITYQQIQHALAKKEEFDNRKKLLNLTPQDLQIIQDLKKQPVGKGGGSASRPSREKKAPPALPKIGGPKVSVSSTTTEWWEGGNDVWSIFGASNKASKSESIQIVSGELADQHEEYMLAYSDQVSWPVIEDAIVSLQKDLDASKFDAEKTTKYKQVMRCLRILHHSKTNGPKITYKQIQDQVLTGDSGTGGVSSLKTSQRRAVPIQGSPLPVAAPASIPKGNYSQELQAATKRVVQYVETWRLLKSSGFKQPDHQKLIAIKNYVESLPDHTMLEGEFGLDVQRLRNLLRTQVTNVSWQDYTARNVQHMLDDLKVQNYTAYKKQSLQYLESLSTNYGASEANVLNRKVDEAWEQYKDTPVLNEADFKTAYRKYLKAFCKTLDQFIQDEQKKPLKTLQDYHDFRLKYSNLLGELLTPEPVPGMDSDTTVTANQYDFERDNQQERALRHERNEFRFVIVNLICANDKGLCKEFPEISPITPKPPQPSSWGLLGFSIPNIFAHTPSSYHWGAQVLGWETRKAKMGPYTPPKGTPTSPKSKSISAWDVAKSVTHSISHILDTSPRYEE